MKENLKEVLENNKKWPILLVNVNTEEIINSFVINADISNEELAVLVDDKGQTTPNWLKQLQVKSKLENNTVLIISNIDSVAEEEQNKFYGLLKYKALNGIELPLNSQIVLTCTSEEKISKKIKDLCIIF